MTGNMTVYVESMWSVHVSPHVAIPRFQPGGPRMKEMNQYRFVPWTPYFRISREVVGGFGGSVQFY